MLFTHRQCGKEFSPSVCCPHCGEIVGVDDVMVRLGPGGKAGPGTRVVARLLHEIERERRSKSALETGGAVPGGHTPARRRGHAG